MPHLNTFKKRLSSGKTVLGTWCEVPSSIVANVIATTGLDFLIIDMEHGSMSYETAEQMCRAAEADDCWPIIRVTENREPTILRALEMGPQAILIPHVENADQARQAVSAC